MFVGLLIFQETIKQKRALVVDEAPLSLSLCGSFWMVLFMGVTLILGWCQRDTRVSSNLRTPRGYDPLAAGVCSNSQALGNLPGGCLHCIYPFHQIIPICGDGCSDLIQRLYGSARVLYKWRNNSVGKPTSCPQVGTGRVSVKPTPLHQILLFERLQ